MFIFSRYIVHFYGACSKEPHLAMVMELLRGTLTDFLQEKKEDLPWSTRLQIAEDIAKGIQFLHSHNPIVRKPTLSHPFSYIFIRFYIVI